jgi:hypothetical protein
VTILLVNSFANAGTCGVNWFNTMQTGQTIGTVAKVKEHMAWERIAEAGGHKAGDYKEMPSILAEQ